MSRKEQPQTDVETMTYEAAVAELESIVQEIETGEIGLEASIKLYERGTKLLKRCRSILGVAEQRLEELDKSLLEVDPE